MTIVGKILVFFNLVFSLVVGAFAVMDYTARTHWADGFAKLEKRVQVAEASQAAYKAEADKLQKDKLALYQTLREQAGDKLPKDQQALLRQEPDKTGMAVAQALKDALKTVGDQKTEIAGLRDQLTKEKSKSVGSEANTKALVSDVERRQRDVDAVKKSLKDEYAKTIQLTRDNNDLRDRAVAAEIQARSFKEMNTRLEGQLQEMARDVARLRTAAPGMARSRAPANPLPDSVEGLVQRAEGNLVTISIGSDAGLLRGHTMEVFRLGQTPRYLGKVRIVEVTPTRAVGQAIGKMAAPMKVGDIVSSRIMPR
jgi:hypothetical protein